MREVKLSDQLGAMAIIDELYQNQQLLLEHLDRETLHNNLKQSIEDYYQTQNLAIDDKTIEKGINLWFDKRLRFNAPKRSWLQRFLVACYLKRTRLFTIVGIIILLLILIISSRLVQTEKLKNNIFITYNHILASQQSLNDLNNQFDELNKYQIIFAQTPAKHLKDSIANLLNKQIGLSIDKPEIEKSFFFQKEEDTLEKLQQTNDQISQKLSEISTQITQLRILLEQDKKLAKLIHNKAFIKATKQYPVLQIAADKVIDALNQGQKDIDINHIETLYNSVDRAEALKIKIDADNKQLQALNVPIKDMAPVTTLQNEIKANLTNLNFEHVELYHQMMSYFIKLAQTPLTLTIIDNPDSKSGIERTHKNTNGKSWYLIVKPMTPTGKNIPILVQSIETGDIQLASIFGQQVTQQAFNSVKADKSADGHIDNNKLCDKPVGRLSFNCPTSVKSGRILEW